jgi:hypothetical protein
VATMIVIRDTVTADTLATTVMATMDTLVTTAITTAEILVTMAMTTADILGRAITVAGIRAR